MDPKPCPNCGAPKHPLKACSQCGLSNLRQRGMDLRSKDRLAMEEPRITGYKNGSPSQPSSSLKETKGTEGFTLALKVPSFGMPKPRSQDLFIEAKAYFKDTLNTLSSEISKATSELKEIRKWMNETRDAARETINEDERCQREADLCALAIYETEVKNKLNKIKSEIREIQLKKNELLAYAREVESEERARIITTNIPAIPGKNTSFVCKRYVAESVGIEAPSKLLVTPEQFLEIIKSPIQPKKFKIPRNEKECTQTQKKDFYWGCPLCHAIFLSEETKNRHISVHGGDAIARAISENNKLANKETVEIKVNKNGVDKTVYLDARVKAQNVPLIETPIITGACRICGKNKPMLGEDICFHCQSE